MSMKSEELGDGLKMQVKARRGPQSQRPRLSASDMARLPTIPFCENVCD